jgi:hypothetical protein
MKLFFLGTVFGAAIGLVVTYWLDLIWLLDHIGHNLGQH